MKKRGWQKTNKAGIFTKDGLKMYDARPHNALELNGKIYIIDVGIEEM